MKLVTFSTDGGPARIGAVLIDRDAIVDLSSVADDMRTFFEFGQPAIERAAELTDSPTHTVPLEPRLHAPIVPKKFFHTAGNYRGTMWRRRANFSPGQSVDRLLPESDASSARRPIVYRYLTNELDYEIELAVIIGRAGKHFSADEAPNYVAGYTIFNDITARDIQRAEMKNGVFSFCKAIDTFCPIGPWIVTPE
jgi:2-keto-4-pentenoate hydratase/2-oxohepta-3-ene-1,7-dioic acid hydratase in catechol pathway